MENKGCGGKSYGIYRDIDGREERHGAGSEGKRNGRENPKEESGGKRRGKVKEGREWQDKGKGDKR